MVFDFNRLLLRELVFKPCEVKIQRNDDSFVVSETDWTTLLKAG